VAHFRWQGGKPIVGRIKFSELSEVSNFRRKRGELIPDQKQSLETGELTNLGREYGKPTAQNKLLQLRESSNLGWDNRKWTGERKPLQTGEQTNFRRESHKLFTVEQQVLQLRELGNF
jgi:SET domain-containing protein